ncbi:hypothetical protein AB0D54_26415 [Streptomyces xanthophaeus]
MSASIADHRSNNRLSQAGSHGYPPDIAWTWRAIRALVLTVSHDSLRAR